MEIKWIKVEIRAATLRLGYMLFACLFQWNTHTLRLLCSLTSNAPRTEHPHTHTQREREIVEWVFLRWSTWLVGSGRCSAFAFFNVCIVQIKRMEYTAVLTCCLLLFRLYKVYQQPAGQAKVFRISSYVTIRLPLFILCDDEDVVAVCVRVERERAPQDKRFWFARARDHFRCYLASHLLICLTCTKGRIMPVEKLLFNF